MSIEGFKMQLYQIESITTKKNKRKTIVIIIAIIVIGVAILGAMKLAEYMSKEKYNNNNKINEMNEQNSKQTNNIKTNQNDESNNMGKLTKLQIETIEKIYNSTEKRVFLTFDDGPSSSITPKILDILKKENIKATFFTLGTMIKSNPEILKREYDEGHYIANHGYSHVYSKIYSNSTNVLEEYDKTNKLIQQAIKNSEYQSNVFRFPGGSVGGYYNDIKIQAKKILKENQIAYLDWNALTNDADGANTKEEILKNLKLTCKEKDSVVLLMHDAPNKDLTAQTLPDVIKYLREQGYNFKNLYDIL